MSNFATRGQRATPRHSAPTRSLTDYLHDHPAIASIGLIVLISIVPAIVEWLVA